MRLAVTNSAPEPIRDPDLPIVDPHHHLWPDSPTSISIAGYAGAAPYSVQDLRADTRSGHNVVATIFVECSSSYYTEGPQHLRPVGETDWVASQPVSDGLLSGIVGYANLMWEPSELAEALDAHIEAGNGTFKGIRHTVAWDGPVSFDFLGYTFRPRDSMGKNGRFTGFDLAASPKAVKRMSETVTGWQLHRLTTLTWEQLADWIGPVIRGWMSYYGRFRHS